MDANLAKRVGFAVVAIPLALVVVWFGGFPLVLLLAIASVLGVRELLDFAERQGIQGNRGFAYFSGALAAPLTYAMVVAADVRAAVASAWPFLAALALLALLTWALVARRADRRPLTAVAVTLLAVLYPGVLPAFLVGVRHAEFGLRSWPGAWLVFFPLVITWVCDTAAMFGGRAIGGRKLAPAVSPGKTISGSLAGVAGALVTVPVMNVLVLERMGVALPLVQGLAFAAVLAVVGQVGDLVESLFKREVGVKDSSALIPGHGGMLDRFDSLYFVLPVAAALYQLFGAI